MRFKTVRISEHQRAVWFRDGNLEGVLTPGKYRFWRRLRSTEFHTFDVTKAECDLPNMRYHLTEHAGTFAPHLETSVMAEREVGLVFVNKIATKLVLPGEVSAYWKDFHDVEVKSVDVAAEIEVPREWIKAIQRSGDTMDRASYLAAIQPVSVDEGFETILLIDGEVDRVLAPGRYAFWKIGRELKTLAVDKRVQEVEINGQEILTKDRVSLRANASLQYRIVEPLKAVLEIPDIVGLAYRAVQFSLRRVIGALTLDELLADKAKLSDDVQREVATELEAQGVAVTIVGIKDVILPGEMKTILNQVVEAEKVAEANAIRRRDDTQSVRALANTARQLEGNPMMARLKELEALESVASRVGNLNVYHGLDGVMGELVSLKQVPDTS